MMRLDEISLCCNLRKCKMDKTYKTIKKKDDKNCNSNLANVPRRFAQRNAQVILYQ